MVLVMYGIRLKDQENRQKSVTYISDIELGIIYLRKIALEKAVVLNA